MAFTQTMTVRTDAAQPIADLLAAWHRDEHGAAPGYERARLLADQDEPDRYVIEVDFSSEEAARENNARPQTQAWAEELQGLVQGQPEYHNFAVVYGTQ